MIYFEKENHDIEETNTETFTCRSMSATNNLANKENQCFTQYCNYFVYLIISIISIISIII